MQPYPHDLGYTKRVALMNTSREKIIMQVKKSVANTPEASYVTGLPWKWNSFGWTVSNVPKYTHDKLKEIFNEWGIGWDADTRGCRQGMVNINVDDRQLKRVSIIMIMPEGIKEENKEENHYENIR